MKRIVLVLAAAVAVFCCAACSSSKGPEKVAKDAISALQKGDYDAYAATFNMSESDQKMLSGMIEEKVGKEMAEKGGIKSFKIVKTEYDETGNKAEVTVHIVYKDGTEDDDEMKFELVDGAWKQVFDK